MSLTVFFVKFEMFLDGGVGSRLEWDAAVGASDLFFVFGFHGLWVVIDGGDFEVFRVLHCTFYLKVGRRGRECKFSPADPGGTIADFSNRNCTMAFRDCLA